jgi:exodeoxyribonuclease V beta subunit
VAELLREHLAQSDPVHRYADLLAGPVLARQPLRGYLTGSLDLVARVGGPASPRYLVVDHKTNRLSEPDQPLTAWHYRRSALDDAVLHAHYPLQAMLYCVALHRFLRWRQRGYDPAVHLGGVVYLFLRGMCGGAVPPAADGFVPGVWTWQPPASLVLALSRLLAGESR